MKSPLYLSISGDDIDRWSREPAAKAILPQLVRRLLAASTPRDTPIDFRDGAGIQLPGYDGQAHLLHAVGRVPAGPAVWELSTEGSPKGKAQADYEKRSAAHLHVVPSLTNYLAVSGRRWSTKHAWESERRQESLWKSVVALDADDLATWLESCPSVAAWFARVLERPIDDVVDIETYLNRWSYQTRPPLPPSILLAGREDEFESVRAWTAGPAKTLVVQGESRDEALHFVASCLARLSSESARALVVFSIGALNWALREHSGEPLLLLPDLKELPFAVANHHVVLAFSNADRPSQPDIRLYPMAREALSEQLAAVTSEGDARRIAYDSGGSISALQRALGRSGAPHWAQDRTSHELVAFLLAGSWTPGNPVDERIVSSLAGGRPSTEIERLCADLQASSAAPVRRKEQAWTWRSASDAWRLLIDRLIPQDISALKHASLEVLEQDEPTAGMDLSDRLAATFRGLPPRASPALRLGIASSLAFLANADQPTPAIGLKAARRECVAAIIRQVLSGDWKRWHSLAGELPALAEAAPEAFLAALRSDIEKRTQDGAVRLFSMDRGPLGGSPHVSIVWALERLAWDPSHMLETVSLLSRLDRNDLGGNVHPRPMDSLVAILRDIWPQTRASPNERLKAIDGIRKHFPEVAWRLAINLLTAFLGGYLRETDRPQFMPGEIAAAPKTVHIDFDYISSVLERIISWAERKPALWAELLSAMERVPIEWTLKALQRLDAVCADTLASDDQAHLWSSLRSLARGLLRDGLETKSQHEALELTLKLYDRFTPIDVPLRNAWLFCNRPELPEKLDWREEANRWPILRREAAKEVLRADSREDVLARLAELADSPFLLGYSLGEIDDDTSIEEMLLKLVPRLKKPENLLSGYLGAQLCRFKGARLRPILQHIAEACSNELAAESACDLPASSELWDTLEQIAPELARSYWRQVPRLFGRFSKLEAERAIRTLLFARRPAVALEVLSDNAEDGNTLPAELALEVLEGCREHQQQLASTISSQMLDYHVERALNCADKGGEGLASRIVSLEIFFLPLLHERDRRLRLFSLLDEVPSLFVELVTKAYRRDTNEQAPAADEPNQVEAATCQRILHRWDSWPGKGLPPTESDAFLQQWIDRALTDLLKEGRLYSGVAEIARMLARVPPAEDGAWPCIIARRLLERGRFEEFSHLLELARYNSRGITSRPMGEGGNQERDLAVKYREYAALLACDWPITANMLRHFASRYEHEAEMMDCRAAADCDP